MGDSDESIFWDERDEDYGAVFLDESFQSNHPLQTANQSFYGEDLGSKSIMISPDSQHQEGDGESSSQSSPLGLTLTKTPSFLNLLQMSLSKAKQAEKKRPRPTKKMEDFEIPREREKEKEKEKLKASNFPAFYIKIGSWERLTRHEGDLTAKLYYAKRKMVWEVLEGALKSKIEIQWSDISAIRAITPDDQPGTLEIELNQPPLFYREINPQPRKHTLWQQSSDFTGGQAPVCRRHLVRFAPGVLDKHYEKLLLCDRRLLKLTENPFPSNESPYFDPTAFGVSRLSLMFKAYASNYQYPYNSYPSMLRHSSLPQPPIPNTTIPAMNYANVSSSQFVPPSWSGVSQACYQPNMEAGPSHINEQQVLGESSHLMPLLGQMTATSSMPAAAAEMAYPFTHTTSDQVMASYNPSITNALYSQQLNYFPPPQQAQLDTLVMDQQYQPQQHHQMSNTSLPQFYFNSTSGGFF